MNGARVHRFVVNACTTVGRRATDNEHIQHDVITSLWVSLNQQFILQTYQDLINIPTYHRPYNTVARDPRTNLPKNLTGRQHCRSRLSSDLHLRESSRLPITLRAIHATTTGILITTVK